MRHLKKIKKLDRGRGARKALIKNLASSLIIYKSIKTTKAKARAVAPQVEKIISRAKNDNLAARRNIKRILTAQAMEKLFKEIAPNYKDRNGGYVRVTKIGKRRGDAAEMAIVALV